MSAALHTKGSPTKATNIQIRRVLLSDPSQVPSDLSSTPGGTLFSTTPGGTRIVYDRSFLLECRNSPLANSPPVGLPQIPGVTCTMPAGSGGGAQHGPKNNGISPGKHGHGFPHAAGGHGGHGGGHGHSPGVHYGIHHGVHHGPSHITLPVPAPHAGAHAVGGSPAAASSDAQPAAKSSDANDEHQFQMDI